MKMRGTFLVIVMCCFATVWAQTGKVRGFVNDKKTEAPVPFANAVLKGTNYGAVANVEGFFVISNVKPGSYTLEVSFVGYGTFSKEIVVRAEKINNEKVYLEEAASMLGTVEINVDRKERETQVLTGVVTLDPKKIQQFSVGGDADIIKAIQVQPGVVTTGDQGGQLYIRGGAPIQNLILLDGMIVYNPFHSIGFFSVFDADIIQTANVYTGGFNAEFGSRNSAVMDVTTRIADRKKLSGKLTTSTYTAKLLVETPLGKKDKSGKANSSFLVSGKTSYLDKTSSIFYPYVDTEFEEGLPFTFNDIYGKFTTQGGNGSKLNLFGFSFDDGVKFGGNNDIDWTSTGLGMDFTAVPSSSSVLLGGGLSYSNYNIRSVTANQSPSKSGISSFNGGLNFTYFLRENDEFKFGVDVIGYSTSLTLFNSSSVNTVKEDNTTEMGGYAQYKISTNRFIIQPGLRIHYYGAQSETSVEPRMGIKFNVNEWFRLKASGGLYSQNLIASNSDRDVVNLFYGFLSGPNNIPETFKGEELSSKLQKAQHVVAGAEIEVSENLTLNIEGYIKRFSQLTNVNRNQVYSENNSDPNIDEILKSEFIIEEGLAKGLDFLATYRKGNYYLWAAYSLGEITRDDGVQEYHPYFDRRHNLNVVGTYTFGKDGSYELGFRYNFGSGFPFTPVRANYRQQNFLDVGDEVNVPYDYTTENGELGTLFGGLNAKRLPNYHRLDMSIKKEIKLKKNQVIEVSAGATNVLNYENIFYYVTSEYKRVNQLPIMPTVSFSYLF